MTDPKNQDTVGKPAKRSDCLLLRLTAEQAAVVERAVHLTGESMSDFVLNSACVAAEDIIQARVIELSPRESEQLANALLNPPPPNGRLRAAAARHWPTDRQ